MNTVGSIISKLKQTLGVLNAEGEVQQIITIVLEQELGISVIDQLTNEDKELTEDEIERVKEIESELLKGKPLAYVLSEWEFYGCPIGVDEYTLIPRPETEELVKLILDQASLKTARVLDVGTGSGCIPIALKKNRPQWELWAMDVSKKALRKSAANALLNQVEINWEVFDILKGQLLKREERFDVIVSNPPYIPEREKSQMDKGVTDYEPEIALFVSDEEPLIFYEAISAFASINLTPRGWLYFETHHEYANEVAELMEGKGFERVQVKLDINGKGRMVCGQLIN